MFLIKLLFLDQPDLSSAINISIGHPTEMLFFVFRFSRAQGILFTRF